MIGNLQPEMAVISQKSQSAGGSAPGLIPGLKTQIGPSIRGSHWTDLSDLMILCVAQLRASQPREPDTLKEVESDRP